MRKAINSFGLRKKTYILLVTVLTGVVIGLSFSFIEKKEENNMANSIGGEFSLLSKNRTIITDKDLLGKPSLVLFGYTSCPDVCPTTLATLAIVLDELYQKLIPINILFVSVDSDFDTPETVSKYSSNFHNDIIGATGTKKQIDVITSKFAVYFKVNIDKNSQTRIVDHSSIIYLMNKEGIYVKHYSFNSSPKEIIEGILDLPS